MAGRLKPGLERETRSPLHLGLRRTTPVLSPRQARELLFTSVECRQPALGIQGVLRNNSIRAEIGLRLRL